MLAVIQPSRDACRVHDGCSSDFSEWAHPELLRLRKILDAGHLNCLERVLRGTRTAHLLRYGGAEVAEEVEEIRRLLAARRLEEAAAGGNGSLVVVDHPFTATLKSLGRRLG